MHLNRRGFQNRIYPFLKRQSFHPGRLSIFFHPFYFIRRNLYKNIRQEAPALTGSLLDFGCGRKPFEDLFQVDKYTGVDLEKTGHDHRNSKVDVYYDGKHLPFPDETFDSLFCSEVLEHVFNPDEILPEIHRVLKPGALALITTPFCWNEHEIPFDYARYSSFGMTFLLEKHGFRMRKLIKSGHFASVHVQLGALYFYEVFRRFGTWGKIIAQLFITPINIAGSFFLLILPKNKSLYFNNIIICEKLNADPT